MSSFVVDDNHERIFRAFLRSYVYSRLFDVTRHVAYVAITIRKISLTRDTPINVTCRREEVTSRPIRELDNILTYIRPCCCQISPAANLLNGYLSVLDSQLEYGRG